MLRAAKCAVISMALTGLGAAGCHGGGPSAEALAEKAGRERAASQALSDDQCEKFARQFVLWIRSGDAASAEKVIDLERIVEKAAAGIAKSNEQYRQLTRNVVKGARDYSMGKQLADRVKQGSDFEFLRVINRDGYKRAVFRLLIDNGGLNYQEFLLAPGESGVKVVDVYIYLSGELTSEGMRHLLIHPVPAAVTAARDGEDDPYDQVMLLTRQTNAGKFNEAIATYERLPEELKKVKPTRVCYLVATAATNHKSCLRAMEDYRRDFPGDAAADLLMLDSLYVAKRYDEALAALDRVDKAVGGDPYLHVLRGNILVGADRLDEAAKEADQAFAANPAVNVRAQYLRAAVALKTRDYEALANALQALETEHKIDMSDVKTNASYAGFRASPHYQPWLESRKSPAAAPLRVAP